MAFVANGYHRECQIKNEINQGAYQQANQFCKGRQYGPEDYDCDSEFPVEIFLDIQIATATDDAKRNRLIRLRFVEYVAIRFTARSANDRGFNVLFVVHGSAIHAAKFNFHSTSSIPELKPQMNTDKHRSLKNRPSKMPPLEELFDVPSAYKDNPVFMNKYVPVSSPIKQNTRTT
jgi:hypothetical protein